MGLEVLEHLRGLEARGSPGLAAQVIEIFVRDTSTRLAALREALARRDGDATYRIAHTRRWSAPRRWRASAASLPPRRAADCSIDVRPSSQNWTPASKRYNTSWSAKGVFTTAHHEGTKTSRSSRKFSMKELRVPSCPLCLRDETAWNGPRRGNERRDRQSGFFA